MILAAGAKVHDLRPVLARKLKQRQLAERYRKAPRDNGSA